MFGMRRRHFITPGGCMIARSACGAAEAACDGVPQQRIARNFRTYPLNSSHGHRRRRAAGRERGIGSGDRPNQFGAQPASRDRELGQLARGADLGSTNAVDIDRDGVSVRVAERCGSFAPPSMMKQGLPLACSDSA